MITSSISSFAMALSLGLNFVALYLFLQRRRPSQPEPGAAAGERWLLPAEASTPAPATEAIAASGSPLVEAEVFLTYGRKDDAARVLKDGLRDGLIGTEELSRFWARHGGLPEGEAALRSGAPV